jgi:hypothetical protein
VIHYHGMPITPATDAVQVLAGRHAFVSFGAPGQIEIAAAVCQSFALDNGAFSAWRGGAAITDWRPYYAWAAEWLSHPGCDWACIPDVIDGDEAANDHLLAEWPHGRHTGVPVFHLHESLERLARLVAEWPRVALGSSGEWATPGAPAWWQRMADVMAVACNEHGRPKTKLHGLRMLNPDVFCDLPLASADSTNIGRNIGIDGAWKGRYTPPTKGWRALVIAARIEAVTSADRWPVVVKRPAVEPTMTALPWAGGGK